jgi:acetolactate decarboxylase
MAALTQFSTFNALKTGLFEGYFAYSDVLQHGDFGIGTYEHLDGEMLLTDGQLYYLPATGIAKLADANSRTPFAIVTKWAPTITFDVPPDLTYEALAAVISEKVPEKNVPVAVKLEGSFASVHFRSCWKQNEPYPTLAEAAQTSVQWQQDGLSGTILGFRFPKYLEGINLPGFHLHFVNTERTTGGHVLGLKTGKVIVSAQYCSKVVANLPEGKFATSDFA